MKSAANQIEAARDLHPINQVVALFSGGHDSLCATHRAMESGKCDKVVHINTGIGVQITRDFVIDTCRDHGWPLEIIHAKEDCGQDYEQLVLERGFPGVKHHNKMYCRLKERCLEFFERKYAIKQGRKRRPMCYISGCRSVESTRRMGNVQPIQFARNRVWLAINHDWTDTDNADYIRDNHLPRNPVKATMCMSGECLCGAFAQKGELREWVMHHGDDAGIQNLLRIRDKVLKDHPWDWDEQPPKWHIEQKRGQKMMFDMAEDNFEDFQHLCTRCNMRQDSIEEAGAA